jgi:hypothetical protein
METRAAAGDNVQQKRTPAAQSSSSAIQAKSVVNDATPAAATLRGWQYETQGSPRTAQLKDTSAMMAAAARSPLIASMSSGANHVLQSVFTAVGEKQGKIRKWVGVTKNALKQNGDDALFDLFIAINKSEKETPWNIREPFPQTLLRLKRMLEKRRWVEAVRNSLLEKGEHVLLGFFNKLLAENKAKWNTQETFAETRFNLRALLDHEDEGPITTIPDEDYPTRILRGEKSAVGSNRLAAWDLGVDRGALDPTTHTEFAHVSTSDAWMDQRLSTTHGAESGELGQGFYTVSGHADAAAKGIRDEFGKTGKVPREVLKFRIENVELGHLVNDQMDLAQFLVFVLQRPSGYPPGVDHMALITRINRLGMALIFPDKTTLVDIDAAGHQYSYDTYRAANGIPGGHSLIVGPQARPSLDGIRQIAARGYLGDKILNEAVRIKTKLGPLGT